MSIKSRKIYTGVRLWRNSSDPSSRWLELGKKRSKQYLDMDAVGLIFLNLIPPPWGTIAMTIAANNRSSVEAKRTSRGVWIKINLIHPFQKARKRTDKNKLKKPHPW
jgi:hypothetical protein